MRAKSLDLTSDIGRELSEVSKVIDENNELASMQPVEENNDSTPADVISMAKDDYTNDSDQEVSDKAE